MNYVKTPCNILKQSVICYHAWCLIDRLYIGMSVTLWYLYLYFHTRIWYKLNIEMLNNILLYKVVLLQLYYKLSVTMNTNYNIQYVYLQTIILYVCTY